MPPVVSMATGDFRQVRDPGKRWKSVGAVAPRLRIEVLFSCARSIIFAGGGAAQGGVGRVGGGKGTPYDVVIVLATGGDVFSCHHGDRYFRRQE